MLLRSRKGKLMRVEEEMKEGREEKLAKKRRGTTRFAFVRSSHVIAQCHLTRHREDISDKMAFFFFCL